MQIRSAEIDTGFLKSPFYGRFRMPRSSRWDKATGELAHCFERLFSHKTYLLGAFPGLSWRYELHEFGHEAWETVLHSLSVAILQSDVLALNIIAEVVKPLPECLGGQIRSSK